MMIQWVICLDLIRIENTVVMEEEKSSIETTIAAVVITVQGDPTIQVAKRLHLHQLSVNVCHWAVDTVECLLIKQ